MLSPAGAKHLGEIIEPGQTTEFSEVIYIYIPN